MRFVHRLDTCERKANSSNLVNREERDRNRVDERPTQRGPLVANELQLVVGDDHATHPQMRPTSRTRKKRRGRIHRVTGGADGEVTSGVGSAGSSRGGG